MRKPRKKQEDIYKKYKLCEKGAINKPHVKVLLFFLTKMF